MNFNLPKEAYVNKFIPKNKFFGNALVNTKLKDEFANKIQRITWSYKLSEETIGITKTPTVEEIQIFQIDLKQKTIPQNILKLMNKSIKYPILFVLKYQDEICYGIQYIQTQKYYFSEWDEEVFLKFNGLDLEKVYQNIITTFVKDIQTDQKKFEEIVTQDQKKKDLEREISQLKNKLKREKQMNKKIEINKLINAKKKDLEQIQ